MLPRFDEGGATPDHVVEEDQLAPGAEPQQSHAYRERENHEGDAEEEPGRTANGVQQVLGLVQGANRIVVRVSSDVNDLEVF